MTYTKLSAFQMMLDNCERGFTGIREPQDVKKSFLRKQAVQCIYLIPFLLPQKEKPLKVNAFRGFLVAGVRLELTTFGL